MRAPSFVQGLTLALAATVLVAAAAPAATLTVKYRSAASVYVDGGKAQGLSVGDRLLVIADGNTVAELEVVFLAERSASCRIVSEKRAVRAGDAVVPAKTESTSRASAPSPAPTPVGTTPVTPGPRQTPGRSGRPWARVRGGVSLGYYRVWDTSPAGFDFEQRTARFDLSLWNIAGQPLSFNTRFRTRQDIRSRPLSSVITPTQQRTDRLYEMSLRYESASDRMVFELGRIGTSQFVGIGYLDGGLARVQVTPGVQLGGFFGRRADIDALASDSSGQKYGGFLRIAPGGRYVTRGGEAILGFVREFARSDISREYVTLESRFGSGTRWSLFQRAEVDVNRGWRRELTGRSYQLSNLSLASSLRLNPAASLTVSYDNRRTYRDFFNRDVPETIFDRLLHQGLRASVYFGQPRGVSVSAGAGIIFDQGPTASKAYSWNGSVRHGEVLGLTVGLDGSGFWNGFTRGWQLAGRAGRSFGRRLLLDGSYGRSLYQVKATGEERTTQWLRLTGRGELGHGVFLLTDFEYDAGDDLRGPRGLLELGYLF